MFLFFLYVVILPGLATGGAAWLLARSFRSGERPSVARIVVAAVLLLATGLWILAFALSGTYAVFLTFDLLLVNLVVALVAGVVLVLRPPRPRRVAGVLLMTAYPVGLVAVVLLGGLLSSNHVIQIVSH